MLYPYVTVAGENGHVVIVVMLLILVVLAVFSRWRA